MLDCRYGCVRRSLLFLHFADDLCVYVCVSVLMCEAVLLGYPSGCVLFRKLADAFFFSVCVFAVLMCEAPARATPERSTLPMLLLFLFFFPSRFFHFWYMMSSPRRALPCMMAPNQKGTDILKYVVQVLQFSSFSGKAIDPNRSPGAWCCGSARLPTADVSPAQPSLAACHTPLCLF